MGKKILHLLFFFLSVVFTNKFKGAITIQALLPSTPADSMLQLLRASEEDTNRINTLNTLARQYLNTGEYQDALLYAGKARQLAEKLDYKKGVGDAYSTIGVTFWYQGDYEKALENHLIAIRVRTQCFDVQGVGNSYNNIGLVYLNLGNYEKSLENYLKALQIKEEIGDKNGTSNSYNNIGVIYLKQNNYEKALENYEKALKIREKIGDKFGVGMSYNNIGLIYLEREEYGEAIRNLMKGLAIREEITDKKGMADSYLNIGNVYYKIEKYEKALEFYYKSAGIYEKIGSKHGIGVSYSNIGTCYLKQNELESALLYLTKALTLLKEIGNKDVVKDAYAALSELYDKKGNYKKAYEYQSLYAEIKDTLFDERVSEQMTEMNTKYESARKDKELIKKDAEISKQQVEAEKQLILRNAFIVCFILAVILAVFIFRGYRQKQKANKLLDEKNIKITDSINYAKRIQESIFPPVDEIKQSLPDFFVFHSPKDVVSGDFYWFTPLSGEGTLFIAAVDCTGHGVPGAFMSMMAYNLLEQVVKKLCIWQPGAILDEVNKLVVELLRQTEQSRKFSDGMDIALIKLIPDYETTVKSQKVEYKALEYAGAQNPLYIISNGVFREIKADKTSIGFLPERAFRFSNHTIELKKGDCCYIFTDGFVDQFGGPNNEKFYYQPFRELLTEIHQLSMEEQKQRLQKVFYEWKGSQNQIDDVLVIGFRV